MPAGQVSDPFESEFGYHLILVTDRKPGVPFDLEQQKCRRVEPLPRRPDGADPAQRAEDGQDRHQAQARRPLPLRLPTAATAGTTTKGSPRAAPALI